MGATERKGGIALAEWLCGAIVGCLPLLVHFAVSVVVENAPALTADERSSEVLFVAIVVSGNALVAAFIGGFFRNDRNATFGVVVVLLTLVHAIFLAGGCFLYGVIAAKSAKEVVHLAAWSLLGGSLTSSLFLQIMLADLSRLEAAKGERLAVAAH